jgi:hypothetical protein
MIDSIKLLLRFDAEAMRRDLTQFAETDWIDHFVTQNYEGVWQVLPLRAPASARHPIQSIYSDSTTKAFIDTPLLGRCAYLQQVLSAFDCPLFAARLMKLGAGSMIKPHSDPDLAPEFETVRLHIPVSTNPDVDFRLNGRRLTLRAGECWYLRLSETHSVANRGTTDRIHLVVDAPFTPWMQEQFAQAERANQESVVVAAEVPSSTAASNLDSFRRLVLNDESLQGRLKDIHDRDEFLVAAVRLATDVGLPITRDEMDDAMKQARRRWREPV